MNKLSKNKEDRIIKFEEPLTLVQIAYLNFYLGSKLLLDDKNFNEEEVITMANRGATNFKRIVDIWKDTA